MVNVNKYIKKQVKRRCPYCHNDMLINKGLTSENVKRLFRKPTMEDIILLVVIFLAISSFLVYTYEMKAYKGYINDNCPIGAQNQQNTEIYLPGGSELFNGSIKNHSSKLNETEVDGEKK